MQRIPRVRIVLQKKIEQIWKICISDFKTTASQCGAGTGIQINKMKQDPDKLLLCAHLVFEGCRTLHWGEENWVSQKTERGGGV